MTMMWPLAVEGKGLEVSARLAELEECVRGAAPLDARLGLPAGKFSYLLQDWDQALAVESPYGPVNAVLGRILDLEQSVASLETMTRTLAEAVDGYRAGQPPAAPAAVGQIVVLSADGKGVPLRKPADAPAIAAHDHARGPKPDRKKMAVLGAAYHIDPYARTPLTPMPAPRWRWSRRCFAIRRHHPNGTARAGRSPSRSGCARCCR